MKHSEEGNKKNCKIRLSWWNDKSSQNQRASVNKDRLSVILEEKKIDVLGISEANVFGDDDISDVKIKGFDIVTDKLLSKFGRARSATYIKNNIKYKIRDDLMDQDYPEIWLELDGYGRGGYPLLYCQFYREQSSVLHDSL